MVLDRPAPPRAAAPRPPGAWLATNATSQPGCQAWQREARTRVSGDEAVGTREVHQFHQRGDVQLLEQASLVAAHRLVADQERLADFLVAHATRQLLQHRELPVRQ